MRLPWLPTALVAVAVVLWAALKTYALNPVPGDEHLYFNMAILVNKGLIPYRDFYFTHPPLHLYLAVLPFRLFGYSLVLGKLLPEIALLVGGLVVYAIGRRALGAMDGALACALFLLAYDPLRISSHFTGGTESFAFAMVGLWLAYAGWPVLGGIAFGLGALVAVYVAPGAAAVALLCWLRSWRQAVRFAVAAAAVMLAGNLIFYGLAGNEYVYQVYGSQFEKGPEGSLVGYQLYNRLGFILYENALLTAGAVAGLVLLLRDVRSRREVLTITLGWFALFWVFYLLNSQHHAYYFLFIMPVFAWLSAHAYCEAVRGIARAVRETATAPAGGAAASRAERRRGARPNRRVAAAGWTGLATALVTVALTLASVAVVEVLYHPYWISRHGPRIERLDWQPSRYLGPLDGLVRATLWEPEYDARHPPWGITHYLQHEADHLTAMEQVYDAVRAHSGPDDTIFGYTGLVQLVSSETGRRIAGNLVDTSSYLLTFHHVRIEDWISAIEADRVRLLVVKDGTEMMRYPAFSAYARSGFESVARIRDPSFGTIEVLQRRGP